MKKISVCLLSMLGIFSACCRQHFDNTDVEGFAALISNPDVTVLDVRTIEEYNEGHIANAINIDVNKNDFLEKSLALLPKNKTIAVYCRSGRRSAKAAAQLAKSGYNAVNLKGGIIAWTESAKPITVE